jgi:hypothetical protein
MYSIEVGVTLSYSVNSLFLQVRYISNTHKQVKGKR